MFRGSYKIRVPFKIDASRLTRLTVRRATGRLQWAITAVAEPVAWFSITKILSFLRIAETIYPLGELFRFVGELVPIQLSSGQVPARPQLGRQQLRDRDNSGRPQPPWRRPRAP